MDRRKLLGLACLAPLAVMFKPLPTLAKPLIRIRVIDLTTKERAEYEIEVVDGSTFQHPGSGKLVLLPAECNSIAMLKG